MPYRITPYRPGVKYETEYRKTLRGAHSSAERLLRDRILIPYFVEIAERGEVAYSTGAKKFYKWNVIEQMPPKDSADYRERIKTITKRGN